MAGDANFANTISLYIKNPTEIAREEGSVVLKYQVFAGVPFCEAKLAIALAFITKLNKYDYKYKLLKKYKDNLA